MGRMKIIAIFVQGILMFAMTGRAAVQSDKNKQVLDRQKAFAAAILQSDWKKLETFCHADLIYTHSFGRVDTKSEFLTNIAKLRFEQWENETLSVNIYDNTAVVRSNLKVKLIAPNGEIQVSQQRTTDVWILQNQQWVLVAHQSTSYK